MTRRVASIVAVLLVLEISYFGYRHHDIVWLNQSRQTLIMDARFDHYARAALAREQISRRLLERIADVAQRRSDPALQLAALDRIGARWPEDARVQLRRAEVLRSLGRLTEAEQIYRTQLSKSAAVQP